jgi:perosamine synthetase
MYNELEQHIREWYSKPEGFIPLHEPRFRGKEKAYLMETIDSTFVSSVGEFVDRFESMMCEITGAKHAVAVVNGTCALHISLVLADVQPNDEVITQPLSFVATCNAIAYQHAIPHFVDVQEDRMSMSTESLRKRLESVVKMENGQAINSETGRRIKACVPMHTFGHAADLDGLKAVCDEFNIALIEDAAESLGSYYKGKHTGTIGLMGTFSFNGNKTVTSGGGGALVTDDETLAKRAKHITTTAKVPHKWEYKHDELGYNYRLPNLNAALACAQLEQLAGFVADKRETAAAYEAFFKANDQVNFIKEPADSVSNYWLNTVRLGSNQNKETFLSKMNEAGIMTRPVWNLLNSLEMYQNCPKGDLSVARYLADTLVNIPSSVR